MNKLAVVTGGSQGIGRCIAERFAREGFDLVTCARKLPPLEAMKENMEKKYRNQVFIHTADMADREQIKSFTRFVLSLGRPIDVLVNNAGFYVPGKLTEEPEGTLEQMLAGNVFSAYYATRGLADHFKARQAGHIFNICSVASIRAYVNGGSYGVAKFALLGFSKTLREELKEFNVRVTSILPGATKTSSWDGVAVEEGRFMKPEDVAEMVYAAYSVSPRSVVEEILIRPLLGDI
jgi:short-subunit dehydrogenase